MIGAIGGDRALAVLTIECPNIFGQATSAALGMLRNRKLLRSNKVLSSLSRHIRAALWASYPSVSVTKALANQSAADAPKYCCSHQLRQLSATPLLQPLGSVQEAPSCKTLCSRAYGDDIWTNPWGSYRDTGILR